MEYLISSVTKHNVKSFNCFPCSNGKQSRGRGESPEGKGGNVSESSVSFHENEVLQRRQQQQGDAAVRKKQGWDAIFQSLNLTCNQNRNVQYIFKWNCYSV